MKHFSFNAREREYRHVDSRDDEDAEQRGPDDFPGSLEDHLEAIAERRLRISLEPKSPDTVLDDDHGAIDD